MEVLQIFNRRTGVWSHRIILTAGYTESFVLDKSTDSAEAKWWEFTDSEIEPPYQDDDWALMMHVENKDDPLTFNADGTTKNATQYIIKSISKDYDEGNGLWKMSCALEEPIERFRRIVGETLSFTNQTQKNYDDGNGAVTYYKEPYNYYTALRRWLMVTPANCDTYPEEEPPRFLKVGDNTDNNLLILRAAFSTPNAVLMTVEFGDETKLDAYSPANSNHWYFKHYHGTTTLFERTLNHGESYEYRAYASTISGLTGYTGDIQRVCMIKTAELTDRTKNKSWYNRIKILDEEWLRSIPFADDTWNEMDLYRILFDKYDPLGKTPVIYFDLDKETGLPYTSQEFRSSEIGQDLSNENIVLTLSSYESGTRTVTFSSGFILTLVVNFLTGSNKWTLRDGDGAVIWEHNLTIFAQRKGVKFGDVGTITEISSSGLLNYVNHVQAKPNGRDEYILKFERQDGFDKPVIDFDELISRKPYERLLSYEVSKDNSTNITGLVCNAENLSSPTVVHYPAQGLFMPPEVNANIRDTTGAPYNAAGNNGWVLRLPFPIKRIIKLTKLNVQGRVYTGGEGEGDAHYVGMMIEDRTSFVLEKQQYLANNVDLTSNNEYYWYEEGENLLYLKEYYWGEGTNAFVYNVEYEPLPSARLLIGNEEKTQQINQTSSQINAESFGRFADGYLKGSNKADITIGKLYAGDYDDFADLIGSRVKRGDKTYMITQVAYRNIGMDGYNVFMQLNENHMRKNASYSAPQEIRANTAIATSNLKNRLTAIKQVVKVGFSAAAVANNDSYQFLTDKKILLSALCPTQIDSKYYPQVALVKGVSTLFTDAGLTNATQFNVTRLATIAKVVTKDQVNLITTFYDNAEAGKSKIIKLVEKTWASGFVYGDVQEQIPVLYTDPFGGVQKLRLLLGSVADSGTFYNRTYGPATEELFESIFNAYSGLGYLPQASFYAISQIQNSKSIAVDSLAVHKDSLEKLNINTAVEVVGAECIVCQDLINLSRLLNQTDTHTLKVWIKNSGINEYDTFTDGAAVNVSSTTTEAGYIQLNLAGAITGATGKTLVISTGTNNPLVFYNGIDANTAALLADKKLKIYFK